MSTAAEPVEYKGKVLEFPLENPEETDIPDEDLHEALARPSTVRTKRLVTFKSCGLFKN